MKSQEVIFLKSQKLLASRTRSSVRTIASKGGYITSLWNWMFWIDGLSWRFSASSFCDFEKSPFAISSHFSPFLLKQTLIFQMCFIRRTIAYWCLNMLNFDAMDFSERRSEEVISFFWRSVYFPLLFVCNRTCHKSDSIFVLNRH